MDRKPLALSNWKMAMTVTEGLSFVSEFQKLAGALLQRVDVIVCPPYTALWSVAQAAQGSALQLGAQNVAPTADSARTGEISAALLADVGCQWVLLGHWEVRRHLGDDDATVNAKAHLALAAGLRPILLIGESREDGNRRDAAIDRQLSHVLAGCRPEQVAAMAFVYEPEAAIGVAEPAPPTHVADGCFRLRTWLRDRWGDRVARAVRIIYGGSVTPEHAVALLASPDLDGLGATRQGRDPVSFNRIVRQIATARAA